MDDTQNNSSQFAGQPLQTKHIGVATAMADDIIANYDVMEQNEMVKTIIQIIRSKRSLMIEGAISAHDHLVKSKQDIETL